MLSGAGGSRSEEVSYSQSEFPTPKQGSQGSAPRALCPGSREHRNPSDQPERLLCASSSKVICDQTKTRCRKSGGTEVPHRRISILKATQVWSVQLQRSLEGSLL